MALTCFGVSPSSANLFQFRTDYKFNVVITFWVLGYANPTKFGLNQISTFQRSRLQLVWSIRVLWLFSEDCVTSEPMDRFLQIITQKTLSDVYIRLYFLRFIIRLCVIWRSLTPPKWPENKVFQANLKSLIISKRFTISKTDRKLALISPNPLFIKIYFIT